MNSSIFFASFGFTQRVMSKSRTSPAMRVVRPDTSKCVTGPMPERPLTIPSQVLARSLPSGETMPIPVTTTRLMPCSRSLCSRAALWSACSSTTHSIRNAQGRERGPVSVTPRLESRLDVGLDVIDGLLHRGDLLGLFVRDFALELFFEGHHQFDGVERVGAQVVDERSAVGHFVFLDAELFDDDLLDAFFDAAHGSCSSRESVQAGSVVEAGRRRVGAWPGKPVGEMEWRLGPAVRACTCRR